MEYDRDRNGILLAKYKSGDIDAKSELVENNMALVKSIAVRYGSRYACFDDLISVGTIGLLKAIDGFDESLGYAFSTYAFSLISGEIKRFLRDDGIIRVSRKLKKNAALVMAAKEEYLLKNGKEPRISELCALCSLSEEEITECLEALSPVRSLSEPVSEDSDLTIGDTASGEDEISHLIDKMALSETVNSLNDFDRQLIALRFYRNLTQVQTAKLLGTSQVSISRAEKRIISLLKSLLLT